MKEPFVAVIPARYASSRFPGKPLQEIAGKPMIRHVWERVTQSSARKTLIATDDRRILDVARAFGAEAVLTRKDHDSGTDRLAEVVNYLQLPDTTIVVNIQGDEPLIPPAIIDQVAANLAAHPEAEIATLAEALDDAQTLFNPNVVKVVTDSNGLALTFSRAPFPWARDAFARSRETLPEQIPFRRHIGLYAYRAGFLRNFVQWGPCWLEQCEALEQLRALWNGVRIHVADALEPPSPGVDTLEDLERVKRLLEQQ